MTSEKDNKKIKSSWRYLFTACAAVGLVDLLGSFITRAFLLHKEVSVMTMGEAASIGIIGGADGPTALFVTAPDWTRYLLPCLLIAVGVWGLFRFNRHMK